VLNVRGHGAFAANGCRWLSRNACDLTADRFKNRGGSSKQL